MKKRFPILEFDPARRAKINPDNMVKPIDIPEQCVISFFNDEIQKLHQAGKATIIKKLRSEIGSHLVFIATYDQKEIALFHPGVGAPLAAGLLEEVIALGCRKFVACGGVGVLQQGLKVGQLMIPVTAVRDEGTSYHYLPPAREVAASKQVVSAIEKTLKKHGIGYHLVKTWTTDAIYRETAAKVKQRISEGCATVEMEAAALFAVAKYRGVKLGQIFYAGDDLSGDVWQSRGWSKQSGIREKLIGLAAEACLELE